MHYRYISINPGTYELLNYMDCRQNMNERDLIRTKSVTQLNTGNVEDLR